MWSLPFPCFLGLIAGHIYMPWHNLVCISMHINIHCGNHKNLLSCIHMPTICPHYIVMYTYVHSDNHTHLNCRSLLICFNNNNNTTSGRMIYLLQGFIYTSHNFKWIQTMWFKLQSTGLNQLQLNFNYINFTSSHHLLWIHSFGYILLDIYFWKYSFGLHTLQFLGL